MFKICNNWKSLHNDIENITSNLIKNAYQPFLIDYLDYEFSSNQNQLSDTSNVRYFKLPYIGNLLHQLLKMNFQNLANSFVKKILTFS